jgi:yjeF C-terminal region, hydroxyethylthiazole kinase-related/yjeF N-terminal region
MRKISALDSRILDINSAALGVPVSILMNNAGAAIADLLNSRFPNKRIAFVCGNGNNGGDGITAAGMMDPKKVSLFFLKPESSIRSDHIKNLLSALLCTKRTFSDFEKNEFDVLVDCALGTGISGEVRDPYDSFIRTANEFAGPVVSVDVPSGLGTDLSVMPDITITFHAAKEGMNENNSGEIIVADIGIPEKAEKQVGPGEMLKYPLPKDESHKGDNGRLLIIGGGPYFGAPAMASLAAMRIGTDIVRIAAPESCCHAISCVSPVLMITELKGDELSPDQIPMLLELTEVHDAVLIGPGLGLSNATKTAVCEFVSKCKIPMVIDADGLTALDGSSFYNRNVVLTPHKKEFVRLGGVLNENMERSVSDLSNRLNATILLKGKIDIIAFDKKIRTNITGTPGMTSAGTGDVLSGVVAGLLSKGMDPFDAACLGAYISGKAGEMGFEEHSYGLIATDVISNISKVLKEGLGR